MPELKSVRIRTKRGHPSTGWLWHYGHFMHDFLMPVNDYLLKIRKDYNEKLRLILLAEKPINYSRPKKRLEAVRRDDFLGEFKDAAEEFLNVKVDYKDRPEFEEVTCDYSVKLDVYKFGPYRTGSFTNLITRARQIYDLSKKFPEIILIERGFKDIIANTLLDKTNDTGANRRHISNHNDLKSYLEKIYGNRFINVVLEDTPYSDQVNMFANARVVIGQHGAGLCNVAWMTNKKSLVVELGVSYCNTFKHMCFSKGVKYAALGGCGGGNFTRRRIFVDVDKVAGIVERFINENDKNKID